MRKTIHKTFWVWDFDKEEKWLNEMSAKGWQLIGVGFCQYEFEQGTPHEYTYKLELLTHSPNSKKSKPYIQFIEDTGAEHIGSLLNWVYFRKKASEGVFDLYSDMDSRITHLKRILNLLFVAACCILFSGLIQFHYYHSKPNLIIGIFSIVMCFFIGYGYYKVHAKKQMLQKEKRIRE